MVLEQLDRHMQRGKKKKRNLDTYLTPHTYIKKPKRFTEPFQKRGRCKLLSPGPGFDTFYLNASRLARCVEWPLVKEKSGENLCELRFGKDFLHRTQKSTNYFQLIYRTSPILKTLVI